MTLGELSNAWNELRNAVLGRGTQPSAGVKPTTATTIGNYYERWRKYYESAGIADDMVPSATAAEWVTLYRDGVRLAKADGLVLAFELGATPIERTAAAAQAAVTGVGNGLFFVAAAISVPLVLFLAARSRR